ncbi:septum formation initiator family protein [Lawsonibacter sp. LCP25S3_G6]|uniref:septum formation initiator family protein n=1 Tax=unclassified Lawsonibacter TaxID=2617946 RepID=UPI003F9911F1
MVRFKRAGILTKLVVLVLLIYMATSLMDLRGKIQSVEEQRDALVQQVANQQLRNQELQDAIENSDDPDMMEQVARDKGFVRQGEELYVDVAN